MTLGLNIWRRCLCGVSPGGELRRKALRRWFSACHGSNLFNLKPQGQESQESPPTPSRQWDELDSMASLQSRSRVFTVDGDPVLLSDGDAPELKTQVTLIKSFGTALRSAGLRGIKGSVTVDRLQLYFPSPRLQGQRLSRIHGIESLCFGNL